MKQRGEVQREPLTKRIVLGWTTRMTKDPEARALEILESMPSSISAVRPDRDQPLAKRLLLDWIERQHIELDERTLATLTRYLEVGRAAWEAAAAVKRARHSALRLDEDFRRGDELAEEQHRTRMLEEQEAQGWLGMGDLLRGRLTAKLGAQIRKFDLRFRVVEEPTHEDLSSWEAVLTAWKGDVTGGEDFEVQTDEWLADYRARRLAAIAEEDPRRSEKLARLDRLVEDLRARRDMMMRDGWGGGLTRPK